jgi:Flp pilus assembly protein TadD
MGAGSLTATQAGSSVARDPIEAAQLAIEQDPGDATRHHRLAHLLLYKGALIEAERSARHAISQDNQRGVFYATLATILHRQRRVDEAINVARQSSELDPHAAAYLGQLGHLLFEAGQLAEAEASLRSAIGLSDSTHTFHHLLGIVLEKQGRIPEAISEAARAADLISGDAHLNARLASLLLRAHRHEIAEATLRRAIELQPDDFTLHRLLCDALEQQQRNGEAADQARRLVELRPTDSVSHTRLGVLCLRANEPVAAELALREAIARSPSSSGLFVTLSDALARQHRRLEAIEALRIAAGLLDAHPSVALRLGRRLAEAGDFYAAEQAFRTAIVADPKSVVARQELEELLARRPFAKRETDAQPDGMSLKERLSRASNGIRRKARLMQIWLLQVGRLFKRPSHAVATKEPPIAHDVITHRARSALVIKAKPDDRAAMFAAVEGLTGLSVRNLTMQFESLGENCELGFVQRACSAEPLSLARFAAIKVDRMTDALNAGFEGMSEPETLAAIGTFSWLIKNRTYDLVYHTFIKCDEMGATDLVLSQSRRLRFLSNKLLRRIELGQKIFVVWGRHDPLNEVAVLPLLRALRSRGPAWLLYVVPGEPSGIVEIVRPGLMRATIDRLAPQKVEDFSLIGWLTVLSNAALLRRGC